MSHLSLMPPDVCIINRCLSSPSSFTENPIRYVRHAASGQTVERRRGSVGLRVTAVRRRRPAEGALQPHAASGHCQQGEDPRDQDVKKLKGHVLFVRDLQDQRQHQRGKQEEERRRWREQPAAGAAETEQQTGRSVIRWQESGFIQSL